ncbi:hypothetical protein AQUCO_04400140v1 [Aquilegia coerulea]|uniref:RING-type domain-containing protein n=1 Tax=Aquilegia coerulea TaxID=218851 RepID=A0A2G5CN60_AQUCA|nr:hypothetical protein AQUCO_04400140v1 [Aquilegia coerulea]
MVIHDHSADCEEVRPMIVDYVNSTDSELFFRFKIKQKDVNGLIGESFTELSEEEQDPIGYDVRVNIKKFVNHEILEEISEEDDYLINLKQLVDPDILEDFIGELLVYIGNRSRHLFLDNSVERLQKNISVQVYNLIKTGGATNIYVGIKVVNMYCYDNVEEYYQRRQALRRMNLLIRGYEDELLQRVQSASMDQPVLQIGASTASIDALEKIKYKPEECEQVTSCSVCYEEFMTEEEITKMPCSSAHIFHTECIGKWLKINHICPICRYKMPTDE